MSCVRAFTRISATSSGANTLANCRCSSASSSTIAQVGVPPVCTCTSQSSSSSAKRRSTRSALGPFASSPTRANSSCKWPACRDSRLLRVMARVPSGVVAAAAAVGLRLSSASLTASGRLSLSANMSSSMASCSSESSPPICSLSRGQDSCPASSALAALPLLNPRACNEELLTPKATLPRHMGPLSPQRSAARPVPPQPVVAPPSWPCSLLTA
mmetsp:Transcript_8487/g.24329  ORF Transcript_8487/g.24329 Transcript_8487/m.24329 type:complete len:214 (+) Transcript_8487:550-1191(+)